MLFALGRVLFLPPSILYFLSGKMPTKLINLNPEVTPEECYAKHAEIGVLPDGTGIQI